MYRVKLVLGLRDPKAATGRKMKSKARIVGAITVNRILDDDTTELITPGGASDLTQQCNEEIVPDESVWVNDYPFDKIFTELRKKFSGALVNTNADVNVAIGTMDKDVIDETIKREDYLRMKDGDLVVYFKKRIMEEPELKRYFRS